MASIRSEPTLERAVLARFVSEHYGVASPELRFVPRGLDSWGYAVADSGGVPRLFLKLVAGPASYVGLARGIELPLMLALANGGLVRVPRPLADREGRFVNRLGAFTVYALEHIAGRSLEDEISWPDDLFVLLADALGAIHASTPAVSHLVPRAERYELPFLAPFVQHLRAVGAHSGSAPNMPDEVRAHLAAHDDAIRDAIRRLERLRDSARRRGAPVVLCHTDFWGSNLLLSEPRQLYVLDWDGAMLAPREADLFMFAAPTFFPADRLGWFLDRYRRTHPESTTDVDILAFYLYRRHLEDLAAFVADIVSGDGAVVALPDSIALVTGLVDGFGALEASIAATRALGESSPSR